MPGYYHIDKDVSLSGSVFSYLKIGQSKSVLSAVSQSGIGALVPRGFAWVGLIGIDVDSSQGEELIGVELDVLKNKVFSSFHYETT